jgi:LacI family transcriptional regulator
MGYAAGRELFKARKHSALIGVNDSTAVGLLQAAAEAGMSAPDDCSVAGFDDYYPFRGHNLTTIRYPAREIAENALGALLLKLHNFKAARIQNITVVPPTLIKRYTTSIPERKTREA